MKRIVLLILTVVIATTMMAENVTPEEALQQARSFIQKREAAGSRMRRTPGTPQLTLASKVSGLYVFNIAGDGGFVIVSNDDRTTPILGFSDSGHIDADKMPDNMLAWLQGYADQIVWLQQHPAATDAKARGQRRVGTHSTTAIVPLLGAEGDANKISWNQGTPYNDLCPQINSTKCVTGCVATAMAQVMKYHQWPAKTTTAIPAYTSYSNGLSLAAVPAETSINWSNMLNSYGSGASNTQKEAVAQLMLYCGCSVEMDYGTGGSSASSSAIATALKNYFGYKETTQFVQRKLFSSAKWADLIYFELAHNRPVIYSGQSSGGGHEFVCDGYQYDDGDYFHINWGWGGLSDTYYVLSALLPEHQGTGGSSSNDGYNYDQDAIIGIQKSTDTGVMSDIAQNDIDLQLNSMTLSSTDVVVGNPVTITLNITNYSKDDFEESTIYVGRKVGDNYSFLVGDDFAIPAGQTQDCEISYTPTATGTYDLVFWGPNANGGWSTNRTVYATLTVVATEKNLPSTNLTAVPTNQSALISWTGHTDNYKVKYRTAALEYALYDNFENGVTSAWSIRDGGIYNFTGDSNRFFLMGLNSTATQYLISSKLGSFDSGNTLSFKQRYYQSATTFKVGFSSTDNNIESFTWGDERMATSSFTTVSVLVPDGTKYVAIQTTAAPEENALLIDDVMIGTAVPAGDWATVATTESPIVISGLSANTKYEYQIIGVIGGAEVSTSASAFFTTTESNAIELADAGMTNSNQIEAWNGLQTTVTLAGRTLYKDGEWNTICLPFNVTLEGSPLEGAVAKTLTSATMTGTTVSLTFGAPVAELQAGVPYIIKWANDTEHPTLTESDLVFTNVNVVNSTAAARTIEKADGHVKFIGYYDAFNITTDDDDIYYMTAGNTLKHTGKARTLKACRAYFQFSAAATSRQFVMDFGNGDATRLNDNGKMINDKEADAWYTLDGRKVNGQLKKGVYIQNGRKVVIK